MVIGGYSIQIMGKKGKKKESRRRRWEQAGLFIFDQRETRSRRKEERKTWKERQKLLTLCNGKCESKLDAHCIFAAALSCDSMQLVRNVV